MAGYIAKYATKSTEDAGGVGYRIEHAARAATACAAASTRGG